MLTEAEISRAEPRDKPYKMFDGNGLYVYIGTGGLKSFRLKFRLGGTEQLLVIGRHPETSLRAARAAALDARDRLAGGIDPRGGCPARAIDLSDLPIPENTRVYFLQASTTKHIKIGVSRNVPARMTDLSVAHSEPLKLLGVMPGGYAHESRLHRAFAHYRRSGEWFKPGPRLLEFIRENTISC